MRLRGAGSCGARWGHPTSDPGLFWLELTFRLGREHLRELGALGSLLESPVKTSAEVLYPSAGWVQHIFAIMSKTHQGIVVIFLIAMWMGCNVNNPEKEQEIAQRQQQAQKDSIRLSNRERAASTRYPNALIWDSLNFQYTYGYQSMVQRQPLIIIDKYEVKDVWMSEDNFIILCSIDNICFRLTCNSEDSIFIHKLIPNLMKRDALDWAAFYENINTTISNGGMDERLISPWIVFRAEKFARLEKITNARFEESDSNSDANCLNFQSFDCSGNIIDLID